MCAAIAVLLWPSLAACRTRAGLPVAQLARACTAACHTACARSHCSDVFTGESPPRGNADVTNLAPARAHTAARRTRPVRSKSLLGCVHSQAAEVQPLQPQAAGPSTLQLRRLARLRGTTEQMRLMPLPELAAALGGAIAAVGQQSNTSAGTATAG